MADLTLRWDGEEGRTSVSARFREERRILQLDALKDWRADLDLMYDALLVGVPDWYAVRHARDGDRERVDAAVEAWHAAIKARVESDGAGG